MTTEQMDWLDDERAGRHKPENVLREVVGILGFEPDADPIVAAHKRMDQLADAKRGPTLFGDEPEVTQAEEPIEERLRRAWLNGFVEGVHRGAREDRYDR